MAPGLDVGIDRAEPLAAFGLRRNRGIVDERMQRAAFQPPADFGNRAGGVVMVSKVDLDVVLRPRVPRAVFRERMPRAGDDAPAGRRKADHGGVSDAAAGSGQKQRAPRRVGGRRHKRFSFSSSCPALRRVSMSYFRKRKTWMAGTSPAMTYSTDKAASWTRADPLRAAEFDAVVEAERPVVPEFELQRRDAPAAP